MRNAVYLLLPMLAIPSLYPLGNLPSEFIITFISVTTATLYLILSTSRKIHPLVPRQLAASFHTPWPTSLLIMALSLATIFKHQPFPTFIHSGWNTLLAPFAHLGLLPLLTPLMLAYTVFVLRSTNHPWQQVNRFTLALFTCLLMWPDGAADLPALGLLILSLTLTLTRQRLNWPELAASILLLATAATSRSIFIYLPLLIGFALFAVWPKRGLTVALAGTAFMLCLNPVLPIIPFTDCLTSPSIMTAAFLLAIVTIQSIYHWRWWPAPQHAAWGLGAPLMVIALSNLSETASFASWYGAIYLAPALPVLTYTLLRPTYKHT